MAENKPQAAEYAKNIAVPSGQLITIPASLGPTIILEDDQNVRISVRTGCSVCFCLDASQVSTSSSSSWAELEYQSPSEAAARSFKIHKPHDLIASAKRGCLYCCIIRAALDGVHPMWETEEPLIDLFLALELPVILRLDFGISKTRTINTADAAALLGVVLHEGENMQLNTTLILPKPAIEVEIYRPRLGASQDGTADSLLSALVQHVGIAEEISSHAGEQACFNFIKRNVAKCMMDHTCGGDQELPLLPDRVVWVDANCPSGIQLVEPKQERAKYIALSYCWGHTDSDTYLTDMRTLHEKKKDMRYSDFPPLFQDAISCARKLGIEYIWIDRLCIIQGDDGDFKTQAPKMGAVYGNATLTIAAGSTTSENGRILVSRQSKWLPSTLDVNLVGFGSLQLRFRRRSYVLGSEARGGKYGKISTRAWTWQERLLSKRTVFYTTSALKFECHCSSVWEGFGPEMTGPSWSSKLENTSHSSWRQMVEEFTSRDISRPSDRLPAITAVMERIAEGKSWAPHWGMWTNELIHSLCWKHTPKQFTEYRMTGPANYAPTWSWLSVEGPISYFSGIDDDKRAKDLDPTKYAIQFRTLDPLSGTLKVAGRLFRFNLRCRITPNDLHRINPERHKNKFNCYYEVFGHDAGQAVPIKADVPLKPLTIDSTVWAVRVSYGETVPEASWEANCIGVLLVRWKLLALSLLLGISSRGAGIYERIGIVSCNLPTDYATVPIRNISIV